MLSKNTIHLAIELSVSSWLVAVRLPSAQKTRLHRIEGGNAKALLALLGASRPRP
jgi:transposase